MIKPASMFHCATNDLNTLSVDVNQDSDGTYHTVVGIECTHAPYRQPDGKYYLDMIVKHSDLKALVEAIAREPVTLQSETLRQKQIQETKQVIAQAQALLRDLESGN